MSSTLIRVDPPVIKRLKGVVLTLQRFIVAEGSNDKYSKMSYLLSCILDELTEELAEKDDTNLEMMIARTGIVIEWVGHGVNDILPEDLRPFAEMIQPTTNSNTAKEISAH